MTAAGADALAFLVGDWEGEGRGTFPGFGDFDYTESVRFDHVGGTTLLYELRSWSQAGEVLHVENGVWRLLDSGLLIAAVALPRMTELSEGSVTDGAVHLRSVRVDHTGGGPALTHVERIYRAHGEGLDYEMSIATERVPDPIHHVAGTLRRRS